MVDNKIEAARKKSLGQLGELFAIKALVDKGFDKIRNLNDHNMNEPYADKKWPRLFEQRPEYFKWNLC